MSVAKKGPNHPMFGKTHLRAPKGTLEESISKITGSKPNSLKIEVIDLGASWRSPLIFLLRMIQFVQQKEL
jgi:hypothetical protein